MYNIDVKYMCALKREKWRCTKEDEGARAKKHLVLSLCHAILKTRVCVIFFLVVERYNVMWFAWCQSLNILFESQSP